ncbi:MAG: hypothetical protein AB8G11_25645, partial [Saprospiraceae bacterium]
MIKNLHLLLLLLSSVTLSAQDLKWEVNLGQTKGGIIADVIQTIDGQVAIIGNEDDGTCYFELLEMDNGERVFSQPLVFEEKGILTAMTQAYDGTFILVGSRVVNGQKKSDGWWLKVDNKGRILENKTFGESEEDGFNDVITATDGDVVMVGYQTISGTRKAWWVKTNTDGALPRMETYESIESKRDEARAIVQGTNGRFVMTGITEPEKGDDSNVWIMDVDKEGEHTVADLYVLFDKTAIEGEGKKQKASKLWEESTDIVALQDGGYAISGFQGPGEKRKNWLAVLDEERNINFNNTSAIGKYSGQEEGQSITQLFNGNIVIGGFTKGYERGANTSRLFLKMVHGMTYGQLDIIYFDKPNKSEKITQLYPTHDGNLLIVGEKYKDKKGAWLGYYALNQGQVFSNISTLNASVTTKTHNQNDFLEVNENGYGFLELRNTGRQYLFGLEIMITGNLPNGVEIYKSIFVNELLKGQRKNVAIPITGNDDINIDKADLEIRIQNKKGTVLQQLPWSFYTGEAPHPSLEVMRHDFETTANKIIKGSTFDLVLEIKNNGQVAAIEPMIDLKLPKGVTMVTDWQTPKQEVGVNEMITVRIPLAVVEDYPSSLINIHTTIIASNQSKQTQRKFIVTVNEPPKVEEYFVDMSWLQPNIGFSEKDAYHSTNGKFGISIQFFSNINIDKKNIELYVNGILIEGARLGEVSLRKSKVDGGNQRTTYLYERR